VRYRDALRNTKNSTSNTEHPRSNVEGSLLLRVCLFAVTRCVFLILVGCTASLNAEAPGWLEGHLRIVSPKEVELADGSPPADVATANYAEYPLIILSRDGKTEIARVTADQNGN